MALKNLLFIRFVFSLFFAGIFFSAFSQRYRAVQLNHPDGRFFASGMNNLNQVCGTALVDDINLIRHAFRYEPDGTFTMLTLDTNGTSAAANAINELGHVIGTIQTKNFSTRVGIWESGNTFRDIDQRPTAGAIIPNDINNFNEAVGQTLAAAPDAYFWDANGTYHELPHLGFGAEAVALNDSAQIGGRVFDSLGNSIPVIWQRSLQQPGDTLIFDLIELGSPNADARVNDISDAVFPISSEDSVNIQRKKTRESGFEIRVAGYVTSDLGFKKATTWTINGEPEFPDSTDFASEILSVGRNRTFYGYTSKSFSSFEAVSWHRFGIENPIYFKLRFVEEGDGTFAGDASGGNGSGVFIGGPRGANSLWFPEFWTGVRLGADTTISELGNANRPYGNFNAPVDLNLDYFLWGVDLNSSYSDVHLNPLNTGGPQILVGWNGQNGFNERFEIPGILEINGFTNLGVVKVWPKLDLQIRGTGLFEGSMNLLGNSLSFNTPAGETGEFTIRNSNWASNGAILALGAGFNKILTENEDVFFPKTQFGSGEEFTSAEIINNLSGTTSKLNLDELILIGAKVDISDFDTVEVGRSTVDGGVLHTDWITNNNRFTLKKGFYEFERLTGKPNSQIEVMDQGQTDIGHVEFFGREFNHAGGGMLRIVEFKNENEDQNLNIGQPDNLLIQQFLNNNFKTIFKGIVNLDSLFLVSGSMVAADDDSKIVIRHSQPEGFKSGLFNPCFGPIKIESRLSPVFAEMIRTWAEEEEELNDNEGYYFPVGRYKGISGFVTPLVLVPNRSVPAEIGIRSIDPANAGLTLDESVDIENWEAQQLEESGWILRVKSNSFQIQRSAQTINTGIRIPTIELDPVTDFNKYRLLKYDCEGKLMGVAGTFLPPEAQQTSPVLFTGMIEDVFNLSHSNIALDTCQYLVLASGESTSAIHDPASIAGFVLDQNSPNPFSQYTDITYELPQSAHVSMYMYNMLGQPVRKLLSGVRNEGDHLVTWNGQDDQGRKLPPGVYLCQMKIIKQKNQMQDVYVISQKVVISSE